MADKTAKQQIDELRELIVAYAKQETIDPLKSIGRYVGFGLGGGIVIGLGVLLLAVGSLRLLQTETNGTFDGHWMSVLPYVIVVVALFGAAALTWLSRNRGER